MDPAMESPACLVLWITPDARVIDAGIYSSPHLTVTNGMMGRPLGIREISGRGIGHEEAIRRMIRLIDEDPSFAPFRQMASMRHAREAINRSR